MEKLIVTVRDRIGNKREIDVELPGEKAFGLIREPLVKLLRGEAGGAGSFYYRDRILAEDKTLSESLVRDGAVLELR